MSTIETFRTAVVSAPVDGLVLPDPSELAVIVSQGPVVFQLAGVVYRLDFSRFAKLIENVHTLLVQGKLTRGVLLVTAAGLKQPLVEPLDRDEFMKDGLHPSKSTPVSAVYGQFFDMGYAQGVFPGTTLVIGDTFQGKTFVTRERLDVDMIIRLTEPFEDVDLDPRTVPVSTLHQALSIAIVCSHLGYRVAIDSLRAVVFNQSGAAMAGGISASLFSDLTTLNNLFATAGVHVVTTLNPMLDDVSKLPRFYIRAGASVAAALVVEDGQITDGMVRTEKGRHDIHGAPGGASPTRGEPEQMIRFRNLDSANADSGSIPDPYNDSSEFPSDDDASSRVIQPFVL
nr:MAG: hypothetical protein 2 [Guangxi cysto-like virus 13]